METNVKAIELRDLWRRYKATGDTHARERLGFAPKVKVEEGIHNFLNWYRDYYSSSLAAAK